MHRTLRLLLVPAAGALVLGAAVLAAPPAAHAVDVQALGPQVGQTVPDFRLDDQHGRPETLASVAGRHGTMLVFFRSADW